MAKLGDEETMIYQNLIDAGCDDEITKKCMSLYKDKKIDDLKQILTSHKKYY